MKVCCRVTYSNSALLYMVGDVMPSCSLETVPLAFGIVSC